MPQATDFVFKAGSLDAEDLRVLRFSGSEGISQCFTYDLELATFEPDVKFEDIVGEPGHLVIHTMYSERHVDGIVVRWEEVGHNRAITFYNARLVPRVWTLTLIRQSRIFQKLSTPDILKKVLEGAEIPANMYRFSLGGSYDPRVFCVQYRETDFEFISRLMEEEGMFFFFEHTEDGHVLVVGDSSDVHAELPEDPILRYREGESAMLSEETVTHLRYARTLRTGAVMLKEFDFKKPALALRAVKEDASDKESKFESYDYPGDYNAQGLGDRLAKVRLEEERAETYLGIGETDCRRFEAGFKFTLEDHPREELNTDLVLIRVRHTGEQPHAGFGGGGGGGGDDRPPVYRAVFECIPAAIPFRPARVTPRPRIDGPQTAEVVGPKGEEIHCDEHGRVKVKFHWDRSEAKDDTVSSWIRVSQPWGGSGYGGMMIPRVGQEVVVEFLEGDPDRPLITGRVYNGANPPPYELPAGKTVSAFKSSSSPGGSGSNEIRFEDSGGKEEFYIHGQKDMNVLIENNRTERIKVNQVVEIDANDSLTVGGNSATKIKGNEKTEIDGNSDTKVQGNETYEVGGNLTDTVNGNTDWNVSGNNTGTVGGNEKLSVGAKMETMVGASYKLQVTSGIEEKAMKKAETITATSKETVGASKKISAAGSIKLESASIKIAGLMTKIQGSKITVDGTKVDIKAAAMIKLEAGGSSITLGPGILKLESAGMVKVQGAIIMLN
ncbi:MAG: type VI secretion system tip protein TssI/VgrG [Candidatus Eisenbacteria bacterium]